MVRSNRITADNRDLIKARFEQHWLHARHVENERLAITAAYVTLVAAMLSYFKGGGLRDESIPLLLFLLFLSGLCLGLCIKLHVVFDAHTKEADRLLNENDVTPMLERLARHPMNRYRWLRVSGLFTSFYSGCCAVLVYLLLIAAGLRWQVSCLFAAIGFVAITWWVTSRDYRLPEV